MPAHVPGHWEPAPTTAPWQWQLQGKIDTGVAAAVYDVDGFEVSKRTVQRLHRLGRKVVCYLDVGSWETYRPDAKRFPRSVIGRRYEGFPDERWLDIRRFRLFAKPLKPASTSARARDSMRSSRTIWPAGKTAPASRSAVATSFASTAGWPARSTPGGWRWR